VLYRLWRGWHFLEREEFGGGEQAGDPPVRVWHATTPIMWDTVNRVGSGTPSFVHRDPDGLNVLYMDGHVEFVTYPEKFPATENFASMQRVE
jgi:prepilin-type processing-associated H-X9-DG protein